MSRVYRARSIKRTRRTRARVEQLDRQILDVLESDYPQSIRHVFYRMTDPRLPEPVEKTDLGYRHVQDRITKLRRSDELPYYYVADFSRRGYHTETFNGASDFVRRTMSLYRADLWQRANYYCEVWVESRSIASVLIDDCEKYAVSLYPCGGFASISFIHSAAEQINDQHDGRNVQVLYVGDYDPSGVLIDKALEREMRKHLDVSVAFQFARIGITPAQIKRYDLPSKPRKASETRSAHVRRTVEAEAMPARVLREILRKEIEGLLPKRALSVAKKAEEAERATLGGLARLLETRA